MNGNDYVEKVEQNIECIEDEFLMQFNHEYLKDVLLNNDDLEYIKKNNDFDEFDNNWVEQNIEKWNK